MSLLKSENNWYFNHNSLYNPFTQSYLSKPSYSINRYDK